jgi:hypothetical protein
MTFILHTNGPVQLGANVLGGISGIGSALGSQVRGEPTSGEIYARVTALMAQKPTIEFTSEDIRAALNACGPMGASLASTHLVLFGSKLKAGGAIDSSGHVSLTAANGILVPQSLSCSHQGNAAISYQAHPVCDSDSVDPWTVSTAATLPAIDAADLWTLNSMSVGVAVTITQHMQVTVNFGHRVVTEGSGSNVRDQIAAIRAVQPTITVASSAIADVLDLLGASGAFTLVLRQRQPGGTFGSAWITLTGTCYAFDEAPLRVSGQGIAQKQVMAHVEYDGVNAPITYTTG